MIGNHTVTVAFLVWSLLVWMSADEESVQSFFKSFFKFVTGRRLENLRMAVPGRGSGDQKEFQAMGQRRFQDDVEVELGGTEHCSSSVVDTDTLGGSTQ